MEIWRLGLQNEVKIQVKKLNVQDGCIDEDHNHHIPKSPPNVFKINELHAKTSKLFSFTSSRICMCLFQFIPVPSVGFHMVGCLCLSLTYEQCTWFISCRSLTWH